MSDGLDQRAINETIARDMNEWTEEDRDARIGTIASPDAIDMYVCECSDSRCTDPIGLTRPEYESVRTVPVRFAISLNHEDPEIDRLVSENERFATVEKFYGTPAKIARAADPRSSA